MGWIAFFMEAGIVCSVMGGFCWCLPWEEGISKSTLGKFVIIGRAGGAPLLT